MVVLPAVYGSNIEFEQVHNNKVKVISHEI